MFQTCACVCARVHARAPTYAARHMGKGEINIWWSGETAGICFSLSSQVTLSVQGQTCLKTNEEHFQRISNRLHDESPASPAPPDQAPLPTKSPPTSSSSSSPSSPLRSSCPRPPPLCLLLTQAVTGSSSPMESRSDNEHGWKRH